MPIEDVDEIRPIIIVWALRDGGSVWVGVHIVSTVGGLRSVGAGCRRSWQLVVRVWVRFAGRMGRGWRGRLVLVVRVRRGNTGTFADG